MSDSFRDLVSENPKLQATFHTFTDKIIAETKAKFGVDIDKNTLAEMHAVKVATLSGDESLGDTWKQELLNSNQAVQNAVKAQELAVALKDANHKNHDQVQKDGRKLPIHTRMAEARNLDAASNAKPKQKAELTDAERKKAIHEISTLRGGAKIAAARKYGLQ